ncbi:2-oxoglutarate dehydrogenase complex dihydrolipoyllysine-residue succinyltransferase [Hellea balneolensis]|uniref:2-oxoglutarate dehydrogenase complex dihydrolipoyllysine-residue succinyltransferase n=1 Tax=Hellea balneolensis TaxID=287478 RepID=UPI00040558EF|nr:2-oxoglutarate dehydrogenase complex dihydrolipoyllysine-residue succinyltransferase [Hellea balneolensis]
MTDIKIPNVGESVSEVTIAQWFKQPGDAVKKDEALVELETDKAAQELVSPEDGVLEEILVAEGDNATIGTVIAKLGKGNAAAASSKTEAPAEKAVAAETAAQTSGGSAMNIDVPNVGESVSEVTVASWMKKPGDAVKKDEAIVELETDKAAQELVAPETGVMGDILVAEGEVAAVGQTICTLLAGASGGAIAPSTGSAGDEGGGVGVVASVNEPTAIASKDPMPSASRIIKENNLDARSIAGTGKDGRITKGDALSAKANPAPAAKAPTAPSAPRELGPREERVRMSRLRQTIARRLKEAQNTAAMLTTYNEVDMTNIMDMRSQYKELFIKKHGVKLGFMSFFVKACVQALKDVPAVNAEIDGTDIIYKNYYDISIAVGTPKGLVVPVLRDCDERSLGGIEKGISELGAKARDGQLSMDDMMGGTFTISNGGVYGSLMSSPILNPPQVGILGMHKIEKRAVVIDDQIVIRPMMYLALSYDHRIVDGKEAVTFLVRVKECLEDPERLLLDL